MAGITLPTVFLLFIMIAFTVARHILDVPISIEKIVVFPMAIVPNLWGLWNVLYLFLRRYRYLPIGVHGALLGLAILPLAYAVSRLTGFEVPSPAASAFPFAVPLVMIVYYLLWKHLVAFFNAVLGIE